MQNPDLSASIVEEEEEQASCIGDSWEIVGSTTQFKPPSQPLTQSQSLLRGCTLEDQQKVIVGCTTRSEEIDSVVNDINSVISEASALISKRGCTLSDNSLQDVGDDKRGCTLGDDDQSNDSNDVRGCTLGCDEQSVVKTRESITSDNSEDGEAENPRSLMTDIKIKLEDTNTPMALMSEVVKGSSPATSTPGSSPSSKGSKEELFSDSMREISKINIKEGEEEENDDDDIKIIKEVKMAEPTLYEKSVEESMFQEAKEANWQSIVKEAEEELTELPQSCVAKRTRSHTDGIRRRETVLFSENSEDSGLEDLEELEKSRDIRDSFTKNCKNKGQWRSAVKDLSMTHSNALDKVEKGNRTLELIEDIKKEMEVESDEETDVEEIKRKEEPKAERKKVTFYIDKEICRETIGKATRAVEILAELDNESLPRRYLESIIKILTTMCIDNNEQMQAAQRVISTMSEVIEDLLKNLEEAKELKRTNRGLNKIIDQLRSDLKRGTAMFDNMMEFTKTGAENRNVVKELAEMKVDLDKGVQRLAETRSTLIERNHKYDELWAHKVEKDRVLKAKEKQVEDLKAQREAADGIRKAEKTHYTNLLKNAKNDRKNLEKDTLRLGNLNKGYLDKIDNLEEEIKKKNTGNNKQLKEIKDLRKYIERLERQNAEISTKVLTLENEMMKKEEEKKHSLVRKDKEWEDEIRKKNQEIVNLYDRMRKGNDDKVELKKEIDSAKKEIDNVKAQWKETYDTLQSCSRRADVQDSIINKLEKEIEIRKQMQAVEKPPVAVPVEPGPDVREGSSVTFTVPEEQKTPVAKHGKPGPGEREENWTVENQPSPIRPSPLHTTTEGNVADSEWEGYDSTYIASNSEENSLGAKPKEYNLTTQPPKSQRENKRRVRKEDRHSSNNNSDSLSEYEDSKEDNEWWKKDDNISRVKNEDEVARLKKKLENQEKEFKRKLLEKEEELKKRNKGKVDGAITAPPQNKLVQITKENQHLISFEHNGMLLTEDGSLLRTPQYETFQKDIMVQLKKEYDTAPVMPEEIEKIRGHPRPTLLNLRWTHRGEWQELPEDPSQEESTKWNYRAARVETYIDIDGQKKKALSYGEEQDQLTVWYNLEDVLNTFSKWKMPTPSNFFNNPKFIRSARRDWQENKKKNYNSGRGNYRGRGGWRGGRGGGWKDNNNSYSSGIGRGGSYSDRRDKDREQQDWEDYQAQRNRERERERENENQGYYTKEYQYDSRKDQFEDRKRPRSPSRGEVPSRDDRGYQWQYRNDQNPDRWEQAPERRSRRDYTPERRRDVNRRDYTPDAGRRYQEDNK